MYEFAHHSMALKLCKPYPFSAGYIEFLSNSKLKPVCLDMPSPDRQYLRKVCFGRWGGGNHYLIQRSKQRYSNMLWNMRSITRHKRSYGHPLHPDLTPDILTCVLPLGTVSSGRESEVESAHLFLTIIQFFSACHLTSHTQALAYTTQSYHIHLHYKSPVAMGEWRSSRCRIHW